MAYFFKRALNCCCRRRRRCLFDALASASAWSSSSSCLTRTATTDSWSFINQKLVKKERLVQAYEKYKQVCETLPLPNNLADPKGVFANNEIDLKEIQVYGFDYDYTLAYYNVSLYQLIFNLARDSLIDNYKFPPAIRNLEYLPNFPIRGLHMDMRKGWFMKIDSYNNISLNTVYHGMNQVDRNDVIKFFNGTKLNVQDIGYYSSAASSHTEKIHHFVDLFCLPEICLIACVFQYFMDNNIHFTPEYIFHDIHDAVNSLHHTESLHKRIVQSIDDYLFPIGNSLESESSSVYIKEFLMRLNKSGKKVFLITNSPYWFVNFGMTSLCGSDWTNLFDLVICSARKPYFFTSQNKPFRHFNLKTNAKSWDFVQSFKKNNVYYEGNLFEMLKHTGWSRNQVLYFGDHIYGDLAEPFLKHGWRTAAIINEVEHEVKIVNELDFQRKVAWLNVLEKLIEKSMFLDRNDDYDFHLYLSTSPLCVLPVVQLQKLWLEERERLRDEIKHKFNPYFGSVFRTHNNPSFFSRRLARFADIYMSNVTNLLNYPIDCHFISRRVDLAHELSPRLDINLNSDAAT